MSTDGMSEEVEIHTVLADDQRLYQFGFVCAHSSDGESQDCGSSIGLGNGKMLFIGELPDPRSWGIKIYGQSRKDTFFVGECEQEAGERFMDLLTPFIAARAPDPRVSALVESAKALIVNRAERVGRKYGAPVGIEMDDGEKGYIVHSDDVDRLAAALAAFQEKADAK